MKRGINLKARGPHTKLNIRFTYQPLEELQQNIVDLVKFITILSKYNTSHK